MRISVCLATYNGAKYIEEQLKSILCQLSEDDELIISDDSSTDETLGIIQSFHDSRIRIIPNQKYHSPVFNFENALKNANGDYIFLSDQDDVWLENKVKIMLSCLSQNELVVSNCIIVNNNLDIIKDSFFQENTVRNGFWKNLCNNHYLGCCMAFRKEILDVILPFPKGIAMHDIWIGLCAEVFFHPLFIDEKLILYRRHGKNASCTSEKSSLSLIRKITYRLYFLYEIVKRVCVRFNSFV